jgi:predicted anti-sigma-YlaC factor YlaD
MTTGPTATDELACYELVELVTDYLEERLASDDRRRFDEHLATCGPCRRYLEQMRTTIGLAGRLREEDLEPEVREAFLQAFRDWRR